MMGQEMAQVGAEIGNMIMNQRTLSGPDFCMERFWKFEAQEDVAETVQKKWTIGDWCLKMMGVVLCDVGFIFPLLKLPFGRYKPFSDRPITYGLNEVECQVFATGKSGPWIQAWDSVKKNVCFQYTMYIYTHNYPHAIEKLETWKCGWYISRNHPGNTYKIIKYSVWYILHIFCIHETLIQLIPSYPVLSHLLQGSMRARSEEMRDGLACYQGKSEGFTIINGMLTKKACLPGEIRYVGTRFI